MKKIRFPKIIGVSIAIVIFAYLAIYSEIFGSYERKLALMVQNTIGAYSSYALGNIRIERPPNSVLYLEMNSSQSIYKYGVLPIPNIENESNVINLSTNASAFVNYKFENQEINYDVSFYVLKGEVKIQFDEMQSKYNVNSSTNLDKCLKGVSAIEVNRLFNLGEGKLAQEKVYYVPGESMLIITKSDALCNLKLRVS